MIRKEITNYVRWSEIDGGYHRKAFLPILAVVAGKPGQKIGDISRLMTERLGFLAARHRAALLIDGGVESSAAPPVFAREPPLLYGVIVAGAIVVFVTLDAGDEAAQPRTISHFDFGDRTMDVWNGFAIAIMVISVRNYMVSIRDCLGGEEGGESDPDA